MKLYVIHENPDWYAPLAVAFDRAGLPHEPWLLGEAAVDISEPPPDGVFWSRMSASSHTRGHPFAKDQTRGVLAWLESHGRPVVNGRRVLDLEMSKVEQLAALGAAGFDVPRTITVAGPSGLAAAAKRVPVPFISKHNQGGKGLGVRMFATHEEFDDYLAGPGYEPPVDGITLLQEYLVAAQLQVTRVEIVGNEFIYAITADTARGGFQLCPADACAVDGQGGEQVSLFALRSGFSDPIVDRYLAFANSYGIGIAAFEFIETADGRLVTYDINTTTNYNADIEAVAPRPALPAVAAYLGRLLAEARRN
ncbi:MAG: ATP-grasp domain-containing protein [Streptosporangiaceae bacterium]